MRKRFHFFSVKTFHQATMKHFNPRFFEILVTRCGGDLDMIQIFQYAKTPDQIVYFLNTVVIGIDECLPIDSRLFSKRLSAEDWMVVFEKLGHRCLHEKTLIINNWVSKIMFKENSRFDIAAALGCRILIATKVKCELANYWFFISKIKQVHLKTQFLICKRFANFIQKINRMKNSRFNGFVRTPLKC